MVAATWSSKGRPNTWRRRPRATPAASSRRCSASPSAPVPFRTSMLQSARLDLHPLTSADADAVALVYGDADTMTTMPWRMLRSRELVDAWLAERIAEHARTGYGMYV